MRSTWRSDRLSTRRSRQHRSHGTAIVISPVGGRETFSGTDFQSRVGAYIAAHILARRPLPRLGIVRAVPIGIAFEQTGAGDDIHVILAGEHIVEVQAKHGLHADERLAQTIAAFAKHLDAGRSRCSSSIVAPRVARSPGT